MTAPGTEDRRRGWLVPLSLFVVGLLLLTAALGACDRTSGKPDSVARDLSRALIPATDPTDTATQRKQAELEKCKYVYHDEQGLRECLVVKSGWEPQDAAREIAIYKAEIQRVADSIVRERERYYAALVRRSDSIRAIAERREAAKYAERDKKLRADSIHAASFPVWGSKGSKLYFSSSPVCTRAAMLPDWDRVLFRTATEAEQAGFTAYDSDARCRARP